MSVQTDTTLSGVAEATIIQYRLLKMGTGAQGVVHCTAAAADIPVGVSQIPGVTGDRITVRLPSQGTCKVTASEAILKGDKLYCAAAGKVSKTLGTGRCVGTAWEAASGDGSIFEMVPGGNSGAVYDLVDLNAATATTAFTDSTGGTPSTTLAAITAGAAYAQADAVATKNALASLAAEHNKLLADFIDLRAKLVTSGLVKT